MHVLGEAEEGEAEEGLRVPVVLPKVADAFRVLALAGVTNS